MSEFQRRGYDRQSLRALIGERVTERLGWLSEAAEIVGGEGALVEDVFAQPPEVRQDAPEPDWTPEQTEKVWDVARRFGYGAQQDVLSGLNGGVRIAEGGLVWKMLAESKLIAKDGDPGTLILSGSPFRALRNDEHDFLQEAGLVSTSDLKVVSEYEAAHIIARSVCKHIAEKPIALNFGYAISKDNPTIREQTGQLAHIGGTERRQTVQLLRVDREPLGKDPETGKDQYRYQPDSMTLMRFAADVLMAQGNGEAPVGLATSNTYASRVIDAERAGLKLERAFGVAMYGRKLIREIGAPVPAGMPLNQLPGDLRSTYDKLQQLSSELAA